MIYMEKVQYSMLALKKKYRINWKKYNLLSWESSATCAVVYIASRRLNIYYLLLYYQVNFNRA